MAEVPGFADWNERVAEMFEAADDLARLTKATADAIRSITDCKSAYVTLFRRGKSPQRLFLHPNDLSFPQEWFDGMYVLDPFYEAYKQGRSGVLQLRKIMPAGFDKTEYFRKAYTETDCRDEIVHHTMVEGDGSVAVGLTRSLGDPEFSDEEGALQELIHPVIRSASRRIWDHVDHTLDADDGIAAAVEKAIANFGEALLTPRERQVIDLVLRGHDTQSVSAQLSIAADTVKLHRKHAYAKLRVSSQGELFYKFLETLPGERG